VALYAMRFYEVEGEAPPPTWVARHGAHRAKQLYRIAQAGLMGAKEAPAALRAASAVVLGLAKIRAAQRDRPGNQINVALVQLSRPLPQYPEVIVEEEAK